MSLDCETNKLRNISEIEAEKAMKKLSMSSNAKEFVPKNKANGDETIVLNSDDKIEKVLIDSFIDDKRADADYHFTEADYEPHFSCGNVSECTINGGESCECRNVLPARPTSLQVSAITDATVYHPLAMYTMEAATAPYGLYGAQSSYTQLGGQDSINYVSPSVIQTSSSPMVVQQAVPPNVGVFQSYHNSGGSSPHSYQSISPPIITGTNNGSSATIAGEHYVMVHVNLGETFSIRVGDQIQNISGPATVRMVSNSGPPTPMPMQVPPGHMVQQIVDENGILTHVILSPLHQPTQCIGPHVHPSNVQSSFYAPSQNNGSLPMYTNNYGVFNNAISTSHSQNIINSQGVPVPNNCFDNGLAEPNNKSKIDRSNNEKSDYIPSNQTITRSLNNFNENKSRPVKTRYHQYHHPSQSEEHNHYVKPTVGHIVSSSGPEINTRDSIQNQEKSLNNSGYSTHSHYSKIRKKRSISNSASANNKHHYIQEPGSSPASSADEATTILTDEEKKAIRDVLNAIDPPGVSEIEARSALIHIVAPSVPENCVPTIQPTDFAFQLYFTERNPDSRYNCVFFGEAVEISLQDLKPATLYYIKVCCIYDNIIGDLSNSNKFTTLPAEPNAPKPVQLQTKTRNSVQLKWSSPIENGSKIIEYVVEYCRADVNNEVYVAGYRGNAKVCKIAKLKPSVEYLFRLAAINSLGQSPWSEALSVTTSGNAPLPPDPPSMARADIGGLLLTWNKRPTDETYCLEMMDEATGYGFITVFNGPEVEHYVENLRRNTNYRFHLAASNQDGKSKWSEVVTLSTKPDLPSAPQKLHVRGKISPTQFVLVWDPPEDDGGLPVISYKLELDLSSVDVTENDSDRDWVLFYEGLDREYQCKSLVPGSSILARVCAKSSVGGWGSPCPPVTIYLAPMPPGQMSPPRKDIVNKGKGVSFTPGGIHLLWEKPDNDGGAAIINYELCQWLLKSMSKLSQLPSLNSSIMLDEYLEESEEQIVYNGSQLYHQISGLIPGAQYRYRIRATNKAGHGKWSNPLDATSGPSAPEGPSEAPTVICKSANVATVSWLPPLQENGSQITEYRLEMKHKSETNADFQLIYSGPKLSFEVKNLQPDSCYIFRVQAINRAGVSPHSPAAEMTTPPAVPSQVTHVRTDSITMHSIQLSWKEPASNGSPIIGYSIEVTNSNHIPLAGGVHNQNRLLQETFTLSCENNETVVGDLLPDTNYRFRIQGINGVGSGPHSSVVKATTTSPPPAPPRLDCLNVQSNSIKLRWHNEISARQYYINRVLGLPHSPCNPSTSHALNEPTITQYQLQMSRQPDAGWSNVYTGSLQFHKLGKLLESTGYYFRIMASNEIGDGDFSVPYLVVTEKAAPPPVRPPKVIETTLDSCVIEWPAVRPMNYDPIVYIVQLLTVSEKDCEFKQQWKDGVEVYRGSDVTCHVNNLSPGTEYMTRVCAVRLCSPSTIEPDKTSDSPVHNGKSVHEHGKSEKTSLKLKDNNSSPVTELLGAFSKSASFNTHSLCNNRTISDHPSSSNPSSCNAKPSASRRLQLPQFLCRSLEVLGPWTDNHAIVLMLCFFTCIVILIANSLQSFVK